MFKLLHKNRIPKKMLILGCSGTGKGSYPCYPWDYLAPCICGHKRPWMMVDEDTVWVPNGREEVIFILCPRCGRRTERDMSGAAMDDWNNHKHEKKKKYGFVEFKDQSGRIYVINPNIDNTYFDTIYRAGFRSGNFLLLRGELPDKWK